MEIKKINIEKATITETIKDKTVFIEMFKEINNGKAKVRIEGPTWFGSYIIELEEFEKDIPFEKFIETVKNQIEKAEVFSIEYIMKKIASLYSKYEGISKITVDFSESLEETLDLHNFIKNYNIFSVTEGNMSITGTKNIIRYIETGFTVLFDKNGVILKFEQPNVAKPKPYEEFADRVLEIKKRLF